MLDRVRARLLTPGAAVAVGVLLACVFLVRETRHLYFFGDDYEFLLQRHLSWHALMTPHNEHWSALPVIAFRVMVAIFGIGHYPAYALMPILLHAANCGLVYLIMRRCGLGGWPAAVVVVPFAFLCGNLGENPLWDFQIGFLGSATFGLLALLAVASRTDRRGTALAWAALIGSLLCSGMALPMLVLVGLYLLLQHGLQRALVVTVPPLFVYVVWYAAYGHQGASSDKRGTADQYIGFVTTGLSTLWDQVDRFPGSGGVVLALLVLAAWLSRTAGPARSLALAGVLTSIVLYLFIGISRAGFGPIASTASRYAYFGVLFSLPVAALVARLVARRLAGRSRELVVAGLVLVVALSASGIEQTRQQRAQRVSLIGTLPEVLPATEALIAEHATFLATQPAPGYNPNIDVSDVRAARAAGELPDRRATTQGLLDVGIHLQVAAGPTSFHLPTAAAPGLGRITGRLVPGDCSSVQAVGTNAFLDLPPTATGSQVVLRGPATDYPARLVAGRRSSVAVDLPATPGRPLFVASTSVHGTLRLRIPPGPVTICLPSS